MNAAQKEFSRVQLSEALISNIVKSAGISRGSFYQYFNDKEDLYFFLLNKYAKESKESFISILKKLNGDIFNTFIEMFHLMLKKFKTKEHGDFLRNAFLNMNHKIENTFTNGFNKRKFSNELLELSDLIDKENLNIADEKEFRHVMQILMVITLHNTISNFTNEMPIKESLENYITEIHLLKKGLCKERRR
nr:TetR family transcriptional regulator [Sporosalibacterium faouarense]